MTDLRPTAHSRRVAGWALGPVALSLASLLTLALGCVQQGAPVVDRPVRSAPPAATPVAAAAAASPKPAKAPITADKGAGPKTAGPASPPAAARPVQPAPTAASEAGEGDWRPDFYTVKKGDTLYSIALDHGQAYRDLAAWNNLSDPNLIRIDQRLSVRPPPDWKEPAEEEGVVTRVVEPAPQIEATALQPPPLKKTPKAVKVPYSDQALAQLRGARFKPSAELAPHTPRADASPPLAERPSTPQGAPSAPASPVKPAASTAETPAKPASAGAVPAAGGVISWVWPARGPLLHNFSQGANPKGIAIGGEPGQPILSGAAGKVVYSGSGLRGYGKLVIIKHDATYLSVYAHNRQLLVKEGERVTRGQQIAEMGSSDAQRPELHFEIRRLGKPVDPLGYLPTQGG